MEYKNEDPKVRFTVPDKPTVRQQLEYLGAATTFGSKDLFTALWRGAQTLIQDWECKLIPDHQKADLDKLTDLKQTEVILWVGRQVREFVNSLEEVPKN